MPCRPMGTAARGPRTVAATSPSAWRARLSRRCSFDLYLSEGVQAKESRAPSHGANGTERELRPSTRHELIRRARTPRARHRGAGTPFQEESRTGGGMHVRLRSGAERVSPRRRERSCAAGGPRARRRGRPRRHLAKSRGRGDRVPPLRLTRAAQGPSWSATRASSVPFHFEMNEPLSPSLPAARFKGGREVGRGVGGGGAAPCLTRRCLGRLPEPALRCANPREPALFPGEFRPSPNVATSLEARDSHHWIWTLRRRETPWR